MSSESTQQSPSDAWRAAIASRKTQMADAEGIPAAPVTPIDYLSLIHI